MLQPRRGCGVALPFAQVSTGNLAKCMRVEHDPSGAHADRIVTGASATAGVVLGRQRFSQVGFTEFEGTEAEAEAVAVLSGAGPTGGTSAESTPIATTATTSATGFGTQDPSNAALLARIAELEARLRMYAAEHPPP